MVLIELTLAVPFVALAVDDVVHAMTGWPHGAASGCLVGLCCLVCALVPVVWFLDWRERRAERVRDVPRGRS